MMKTQNYQYIPQVGLALVLVWIGGMKFTAYEAGAISGLISNHPLMSWIYEIMSQRTTSALIGLSEIAIALLLLAQPWKPKLSLLGGLGAVGMFLTTLSFTITTPGVWEPSLGGFPAASVMPGQFLLKDIALLAISLWVVFESRNRLAESRVSSC